MKHSRAFGLLLITLTYLVAIGIGIILFLLFDGLALWARVLLADVAATVFVYFVSLLTGNATVYDPYWSVQPMIIVPLLMAHTGAVTPGSILLLILIELWGLRLTANWVYTFKDLSKQDWRYDNLKKSSGVLYPIVNLIGIQMMPTLVVFACQMPVIAYLEAGAPFSVWSVFGAALLFAGIMLEFIPDIQKHSFRARGGKGVMNEGFWKNGRHPNYLGEILIWWGVYSFVLAAAPELWWTFFGAFLNTLLFVFISIPMAEKQSALRHTEEWEEYKKNTRLFI